MTEQLAQAAVHKLEARGQKAAFAESCTGGWLAKLITDTPGASAVFDCGIVSYSNDITHRRLGVPEDLLERFGAVSEPVARSMAQGVRRTAGSDYGIGVTGVAGPGGGTEYHPVGTCYIGIAAPGGTQVKRVDTGYAGAGCRSRTRSRFVQEALELLIHTLEKEDAHV
ncbi:MAG: CinA family protein [Clostridiales bacterium]|nr:CinA family protein [Clostridiales bacterium]